MKRIVLLLSVVLAASCAGTPGPLPRAKASASLDEAFASYLQAVADSAEDLHSVMVLQHGRVLEEKFFVPDTAHILNSVSKTFTSTAVGFAITEGLPSLPPPSALRLRKVCCIWTTRSWTCSRKAFRTMFPIRLRA